MGKLVLISLVMVLSLAACSAPTGSTTSSNVYYLWYADKRSAAVPVVGHSHRYAPVDGYQLIAWFLNGTACDTEAGVRVYRRNENAPYGGVAVEVAEGACRGFSGWVPRVALQTVPR